MAETENDLSDWNPMAEDFYEANANKYENDNQTVAKDEKNDRNTKQMKYPFLLIKKENTFITPVLLRNFIGNAFIYDIEYRTPSRVYLVFFHNVGSLEAAWTKIRQFPRIINCVEGRPKQHQEQNYKEEVEKPAESMPSAISNESSGVNFEDRTMQVSASTNKHPVFLRPPIVTKAEYTAKNSLLALNDPNQRSLSIKYDFNLERHGAYVLQEIMEKEQAVFNYRSGRLIVTPKIQLEEPQESDAAAKLGLVAKKCFACSCYTDNSCRFCQMPFCNPACFELLSAAHQQSCEKGSPPLIDADAQLLPAISNLKLPRSGSSVKITAFEQTNVMYIRSADIMAEVAYYKGLSEVMMRGKLSKKLTKMPQCGQLVIYKFDLQIVRAMVLKVDTPNVIYLVCIDFGSVEITTLECLYDCSPYLAALPRYAIPVLLRNVPRRFICPNLRKILYELDHNYTFVLKYSTRDYDYSKGMQRVVLIESDLNRSLNRLINTILTPVEPPLSDVGYKEDYLAHVHLPTGKGIDMVVMDNTFIKFGVIHCSILDYAYEISQMQCDIQSYGDSVAKLSFYAPSKGCLCIAKYLGNWCRGLCMELVGDGYPSILFIDYGNIRPIHVDDIRPYPPQFTFPMLTTEYELIDVPTDLSKEALGRLECYFAVGAIVNFDEVVYNKEDNNYSLRSNAIKKLI